MIKYLLYDALLRPGAWNQAVLNDRDRAASWLRALAALLRGEEEDEEEAEEDQATDNCEQNLTAVLEGGSSREQETHGGVAGSVVFLGSLGKARHLKRVCLRQWREPVLFYSFRAFCPVAVLKRRPSLPAFVSSLAGADLPLLPMALSCLLLETEQHQAGGAPAPVVLVEPIRPIAAATASCLEDNDLCEHMTVVSEIADVKGDDDDDDDDNDVR